MELFVCDTGLSLKKGLNAFMDVAVGGTKALYGGGFASPFVPELISMTLQMRILGGTRK